MVSTVFSASLGLLHRTRVRGATYADIILELDSSRRVQLDLLQSLAHDIVRLSLGLLGCFDGRRFVDVALVVDVKLAEGVGQAEDLVLLELRKLPGEGTHCQPRPEER